MISRAGQPERVLSGMRPTGRLHLGHYHGVLKNWIELQHEFDCYYFVADWHALTTHYEDDSLNMGEYVWEMVVDWLAAKGFSHDVITDEDLDREGLPLLAPYRAVVTGSHPEYVSDAMMGAFEGYLDQGGRLVYLGGNGFYWQTVFHAQDRGIIECRKSEGVRNSDPGPGERHHAFDGQLGGLWRNRGRGSN